MSNDSKWTVQKILDWTTSYFKSNNIEGPRSSAEILLAHALRIQRIELYLRYDQPLDKGERSSFKELIKRRINREPVAYITGKKGFWLLNFSVTRDVLIPRPETESLLEETLLLLPGDTDSACRRILELGTGSGAIIISLTSERPWNQFFASDYSQRAIMVAKKNAEYYNLGGGIFFFVADWIDPIITELNGFDIIVSNPPYIQTKEISALEPEIYKYEPVMALDGGDSGLCHIAEIINKAHKILAPSGWLLLEMGCGQQDAVQIIIDGSGEYDDVVFVDDCAGITRVVKMKKRVV